MKQLIKTEIKQAIQKLIDSNQIAPMAVPEIILENAKNKSHGDFACNIAMLLAKPLNLAPRKIAELIVAALPTIAAVEKIEIAGPGFINFFLSDRAFHQVIQLALSEKENFGKSNLGQGKKIIIETLSANPTGPLHVGHGRLAAYGQSVADLLAAVGFEVYREYYLNDAGRQMRILAASTYLRYLALSGENCVFPSNAYRGEYVIDIAKTAQNLLGDEIKISANEIFQNLPKDEPQGGDKDVYIDAVVARIQNLIGEAHFNQLQQISLTAIAEDIREDLSEFGVTYQNWFAESSLIKTGALDHALELLEAKDLVYLKDGALWFRASLFGDEKDRVLKRENGQPTYFAADVAYHLNKFERGFDQVINILGSDHHGYAPRIHAAVKAFGIDPARVDALLVQFAILYRGQEKISMSTRAGEFVTLRELRKEVGNDAARYFYIMRKREQHLDFDLELAKAKSNENPVYYIQYAHARICSVMHQAKEKGLVFVEAEGLAHLNLLQTTHETDLIKILNQFVDQVQSAALNHEPHTLANYLQTLAQFLHAYYNAEQFLVENAPLRQARLCLILAVRHALANGLKLLGLSAPENM